MIEGSAFIRRLYERQSLLAMRSQSGDWERVTPPLTLPSTPSSHTQRQNREIRISTDSQNRRKTRSR